MQPTIGVLRQRALSQNHAPLERRNVGVLPPSAKRLDMEGAPEAAGTKAAVRKPRCALERDIPLHQQIFAKDTLALHQQIYANKDTLGPALVRACWDAFRRGPALSRQSSSNNNSSENAHPPQLSRGNSASRQSRAHSVASSFSSSVSADLLALKIPGSAAQAAAIPTIAISTTVDSVQVTPPALRSPPDYLEPPELALAMGARRLTAPARSQPTDSDSLASLGSDDAHGPLERGMRALARPRHRKQGKSVPDPRTGKTFRVERADTQPLPQMQRRITRSRVDREEDISFVVVNALRRARNKEDLEKAVDIRPSAKLYYSSEEEDEDEDEDERVQPANELEASFERRLIRERCDQERVLMMDGLRVDPLRVFRTAPHSRQLSRNRIDREQLIQWPQPVGARLSTPTNEPSERPGAPRRVQMLL
jgi:hypothetical protein